jgi:hypothetical protein
MIEVWKLIKSLRRRPLREIASTRITRFEHWAGYAGPLLKATSQ